MNETNLPEARWRSWRPRQPTAGLKRRIFGDDSEPAASTAKWFWGCLAPATACALFTLLAFNSGSANINTRPMMAMVMSNQNYAAYASGDGQTSQNHLAAVTFDWTNHGGFQSSIGFTPTTNSSN